MMVKWGGRKRSRRPADTASPLVLMPFGKYAGVEVSWILTNDRAYCVWLCQQAGFRSNYPQLHATFTQNGATPHGTPAHNEMQLRFMDDEWCMRLTLLLNPSPSGCAAELFKMSTYGKHRYAIVGRELEAQAGGGWWDVRFQSYVPPSLSVPILVECKTSIGDDWPEVLRQVKRRNKGDDRFDQVGGACACVVVRSWDSTNYWASVAQAFQAEHITLVSEAWIGAA